MHKKYAVLLLLFIGAFFLLVKSTSVFAATGTLKQINFQGKVVNKTSGTNVTDGSYSFTFKIYSVDTGGAAIWTETKNITVTNGIFQTLLGDTTSLPGSVDFNTDNIYLGINFNGDGEMSPRVRFAAVPQAFNALKVAGLTVTDTTGTLTIPSGKTIQFADAFTTSGANPLTLTTTGSTNITLPTTGTLVTLAGSENLTNKTIGSTGLTFSGAATDVTTGTDEDFAVTPNGNGNFNVTLAAAQLFNVLTGNLKVGNGTPGVSLNGEDAYIEGTLEVDGALQFDSASITLGNAAFSTCTALETVSGVLTCGTDDTGGGSGTNYWRILNGAISPVNDTLDLLIGNSASTSAAFAFLNINSGTPTASFSGKLVLDSSTADIQSTENQALTIGGNTTGNITLIPLNGDGVVNITGDLDISQRGAIGSTADILENTVFSVGETITSTMPDSLTSGISSILTLNPSGPITSSVGTAGQFLIGTDSGNSENFNIITGVNSTSSHLGTGTVSVLAGGMFSSSVSNAGSTTANIGVYASPTDGNTVIGVGTEVLRSIETAAGSATGFSASVSNTSVITSGTDETSGALFTVNRTGATGGTIENMGIKISLTSDNAGAGTSTAYGIKIGDITGADTNYSIYSEGGQSYFVGGTNILGHSAFGANSAIDSSTLIYSGDTFNTPLLVQESFTDLSADHNDGIMSLVDLNPSTAPPSLASFSSGNFYTQTNAGNAENFSNVVSGVFGYANHKGSGTMLLLSGGTFTGESSTFGTSTYVTGVAGQATNGVNSIAVQGTVSRTAESTSGSAVGGRFDVTNSSPITTGTDETSGVSITMVRTGATGGTINSYGVNVAAPTLDAAGAGTHTAYGVYVGNITGADTNYSLYSAGGQSYFAGNVGIGDSSPSSKLEIGDGTDSLQISSVGDLTFVDANDGASITGPAGGILTIASANSQGLTIDSASNTVSLGASDDLSIPGGDLTGANSAAIDLGEATTGAITFTAGTTGDFVFSLDADSNVQFTAGSVPGVDMIAITNTGQVAVADGVDGIAMDFRTGDGTNPTNSGINLSLTSGGTAAGDVLNAIKLSLSGTSGTERAIDLGTGWDASLYSTGNIVLGGTATGNSATLLVLPIKTDAEGSLAGTNGAIYYNSNSSKFRCYQGGAWTDCIGSGGTTALDTLTAATTDDTALSSGDNTIEWDWALTSATSKGFTIGESAASTGGSGDQHLLKLLTASGSTAGPLEIISTSADTGDIEFNLASTGDFEIQDAGTAFFTFNDDKSISYDPLNTGSMTITSDLSGGARSTDVLTITQPSDSTFNNSANLLQLTNADSGSTAAIIDISQQGNTGITISGSQAMTAVTVQTALNTGVGLNINSYSFSSGQGIKLSGAGSGSLTAFSGDQILINPTRNHSGATTITESGNYLDIQRSETISNAGGTIAITGDLVTFSSLCTISSGTCTDNSNILSLAQSYASATGSVLDITNAGTGQGILLTSSSTGILAELDSTGSVTTTDGLLIQATHASGVITDGIDLSDAEIVNALNIGTNTVLGSGSLSFDLVNGSDDTLTLTNSGAGVLSVSLEGDITISGNDITFGNAETISNQTNNVLALGGTVDSSVLRLHVKTTTGDSGLDATEGNIYYNTFDNKFRCYQGSAWTDCIGTGGSSTLQQAYDAGTPTILTDASGDVVIQLIGGATDTQFRIEAASASEVDLMSITNSGQGTTTDNVDGLSIDFTQADNAAATDDNNAIHITLTSSSGDAGDTLDALEIANVTGGSATERGVVVGTGFDRDIEFVDTTPVIRVADGVSMTFDDGSGAGDLALGRLKEYFSTANYGVFESGGFINIDGSFFMDNFSAGRLLSTADGATNRFGDGGAWLVDEAGTGGGSTATNSTRYGCNVQQNQLSGIGTYPSQGMLEISPETSTHTHTNADPGCVVSMAAGTGTNTGGVLRVTNKFVSYAKIKVSANFTQAASARQMFWGAHNYTEAWGQGWGSIAATHGFIGFSNLVSTTTATNAQGGTQWNGFARSGNSISSVTCGTYGNISTATNVYALMRIEARATNDVHFFIDGDTSNGVSMTECGSGISSNIATQALNPAFNVVQQELLSGATNQWTMFVDLFAFVQDDPRPLPGEARPSYVQTDQPALVPPELDPITGADVAEHYQFTQGYDTYNRGDIVVIADSLGFADTTIRPYDRRILGVIAESPGLTLGQYRDEKSLPVAISGRVPVRVNTNGGPIAIGDPITSSNIRGVGMKATKPGKIIGTAMQSYEGAEEGRILVNVNVGYYLGDEQDTALLVQKEELQLDPNTELSTTGSVLGSSILATQSGSITHATASAIAIPTSSPSLLSRLTNMLSAIRVTTLFESFGDAIFKGPSTFLGSVIFGKQVQFTERVQFNSDTAGRAKITKGSRFVDIVFTNPYEVEPVITVNPIVPSVSEEEFVLLVSSGQCEQADGKQGCQDRLANLIVGNEIKYAVVSRSTQGFMILLSNELPFDLSFSWTALNVGSTKMSVSKERQPIQSTPIPASASATLLVEPSPSPTAAATPADVVEPTPSPTPSPSPSPPLLDPTLTPESPQPTPEATPG